MAGCTTDCIHEKKPGGGWTYNNPGITYNMTVFDGIPVTYNTLGQVTTWTYEEPIDGCNVVVTFLAWMDGDDATFQDGDTIQFN